jgi:hypothetical protein
MASLATLHITAPLLLAGHAVAAAVHLHSGAIGEEKLRLLAMTRRLSADQREPGIRLNST